jgi:hypothetical protein
MYREIWWAMALLEEKGCEHNCQIDLSEMGHKYLKLIELAEDYNKLQALVLVLNLHVLLLEIIAF